MKDGYYEFYCVNCGRLVKNGKLVKRGKRVKKTNKKCKCNRKKGIVCDYHFFPRARKAYFKFVRGE
jgi:hypothetical protein